MNKLTTLREALVLKLQVLYDMEQELIKALPAMAAAATHPDLKEAFQSHLEETENHVVRLEQCFAALNEEPKTEKSEGIRGIIKDAEEIISKKPAKGLLLDAMLISSARYAEHYEMAGYLSASAWAELLEEAEVMEQLRQNLEEEEEADEKLESLAENDIDPATLADEVDDTDSPDEPIPFSDEELI